MAEFISFEMEGQLCCLSSCMSLDCWRGVDLHVVDRLATCLHHNGPYMHIDVVRVDILCPRLGPVFASRL
jgi:hypothetical protein